MYTLFNAVGDSYFLVARRTYK